MIFIGTKDERTFVTNAPSIDEAYRQIGHALKIPAHEVENIDLDELISIPVIPEEGKTLELKR